MNLARIELLKSYFTEHPEDPFNAYALALEYVKSDPKEAHQYFQLLLKGFEDYLPTYYQAGKYYHDQGDSGTAIALFEKGIRIAKMQGDQKTERELKSALDEMLMD